MTTKTRIKEISDRKQELMEEMEKLCREREELIRNCPHRWELRMILDSGRRLHKCYYCGDEYIA